MENVKAANTGKACLANSTFSDCREGKGPGVGTVSSAWVAESASKLPSQNSLVRKEIILFAFLKPGDAHPSVNSQFSARSLHRLFLLSFFLKCCSSKQTTNEMADEYWQSWNNMLYGGKKACSNKGRKIHNNKKPVKERENEGTSLDTVTEAFKVFFFQNKGCCVQPPLPLLIPAAPSVVPAQVLCDCELNQIKALIQGKKKKKQQHHQKQTGKERQKERKLQSSCYCCQKRCQASHSLARTLQAWGCRADRWATVPWDLQPGQTVKTHRPVLPQAAAEFDL